MNRGTAEGQPEVGRGRLAGPKPASLGPAGHSIPAPLRMAGGRVWSVIGRETLAWECIWLCVWWGVSWGTGRGESLAVGPVAPELDLGIFRGTGGGG